MYSYLFASDRCLLFQNIATEIWHKIINAHDVGVNTPEIGITADIITNILQYSKYHKENFEIYARNSWNEKLYGSDIDLFVETEAGKYIWFALQAKVLKTNKKYESLKDGYDVVNSPIYQWEKLTTLERITGCIPYYLFYNGVEDYRYEGLDKCGKPFRQEQFGCSIVKPIDVQRISMLRRENGSFITPTFTDFHPNLAQPWRTLVCCLHDLSKLKHYTYAEIVESIPNLKKLEKDKNQETNVDESKEDSIYISEETKKDVSFIEGNEINNGCIQAKWNPDIRIIVRHSDIKFKRIK